MKNIITTVIILNMVACSTLQAPPNVHPTPSAYKAQGYEQNLNECKQIADSAMNDTGSDAVFGAAFGAGLITILGLMLGVDSGLAGLAGVGAVSGGLSSFGASSTSNANNHKSIMVQCMRDRGYEVY